VEDIGNGKYKSLDEARRRNGIRGGSTVKGWIKRYGREEMLPKRIKAETMNEIDELKVAKRRVREPEAALCATRTGVVSIVRICMSGSSGRRGWR
jgi:hypothetical protein